MGTNIVSNDPKSRHYRAVPFWKRASLGLLGAAASLFGVVAVIGGLAQGDEHWWGGLIPLAFGVV